MSDGKLKPVKMSSGARKTPNRNKVPRAQWNRWSDVGKDAFNSLYEMMIGNQSLFLHPKQKPPSFTHWQTTSWNAAWIAADVASGQF